MEELISRKFDNEFKKISGLNLFPWVGKEYQESNRRILIVGESHYLNEDNPDDSGFEMTRNCIDECAVYEQWNNNTYKNINRVLCSEELIDNKALWSKLCYYNFIPRIMNTNSNRPTNTEFVNSWGIFLEIIEILKPTDCIFIGVKASDSFGEYMTTQNMKSSYVETYNSKIGTAYPRTALVLLNDYSLKISFIQHPGRLFPVKEWNQFLVEHESEAISYIQKEVLKTISNDDKNRLVNDFLLPQLKEIADELGLNLLSKKGDYVNVPALFLFSKSEWKHYDIGFETWEANFMNFTYGYRAKGEENKNLKILAERLFETDKVKFDNHYNHNWSFAPFYEFRNWYIDAFLAIQDGRMKREMKNTLEKMLKTAQGLDM